MRARSNTAVDFHEEQQFRQPWVWILLLLLTLGVSALFIYGIYKQLYLGQAWGDRPMTDNALIFSAVLTVAVSGGACLLFYTLRLITIVNGAGIQLRFFPLTRKNIRFDAIRSCKAVRYHPIREYGGWGIRFSKKGRAYNVSGDRGVQLELSTGKSFLIGSQKADELADAINAHLSHTLFTS
ncbi:MAG: hypothetical protein HKP12_07725 [Gammaproteobacteria bacterium]|nr:hypothetical protein [Gammaproteobacteria bacterium]